MTYREALRRAVATFVAGATAVPLTTEVVGISFFKAAAVAGVIAVWNLLGRLAQTWLTEIPGDAF